MKMRNMLEKRAQPTKPSVALGSWRNLGGKTLKTRMARETMMTIAMTMPMKMTIAMEVTYIKTMMTNVNGSECNADKDYPGDGIMTNDNVEGNMRMMGTMLMNYHYDYYNDNDDK